MLQAADVAAAAGDVATAAGDVATAAGDVTAAATTAAAVQSDWITPVSNALEAVLAQINVSVLYRLRNLTNVPVKADTQRCSLTG